MRALAKFPATLRRRPRWQKALLIVALVVLATGAGVWLWLIDDLPSVDDLTAGLALPSTRIYDRNGRLLYEILPPQQGRNVFVPLAEIPPACVNAVIAVEDANYYAHPGVDLIGVLRALWINLRGGEVLAGGSTITQQLARTVLLDPAQRAERTLERKLRESILALRLHNRYSKEDILELYLNQVYFGNLAYGIEGAARAYFAKPARALSLAECALLAGIIQNPALHDPLTRYDSAKARQRLALGLMVANGMIAPHEAISAEGDDLRFAATRFPIEAPHFVMMVWAQLERDHPEALYRRGLDVITTLDLDWHNTAQRIINRQLHWMNHPQDGGAPANAHNAALVALDPHDGQVRALVGSPDYFNDRISGAVNAALALRQPGSALKPFTYAAAMDPSRPAPWTAASFMLDVRTGFVTRKLESYIPGNYGMAEHGPVLVREALAGSYNIPAVLALENVGVPAMIQLAASAGLVSLLNQPEPDLAVTLGGTEVSLLELTQAYSAFANGGYFVEPVIILQVTDRATGESLYDWQASSHRRRVLDERVAYLITDILSDPLARARAFGRVSALDIGRPAAAKTGTTTDFRDNWIAGYTPELVAGVWVGNADNSPMRDVTGISGAAPIWNEFMRAVHQGKPARPFRRPAGLIEVEICALSGLLPTPDCPARRVELFIPGTEPTTPDTLHQAFEIDRLTGALADETTPPQRRVRQVFVVLPPEGQAWGARNGYPLPPGLPPARPGDADRAEVRVLTPEAHNLYQVAPNAPPHTQRLRLTAAVPPATRAVTYTLNGEPVARVESAPFTGWWMLTPGDYTLTATATLPDGTTITSAPQPFQVIEYLPYAERLERLNTP